MVSEETRLRVDAEAAAWLAHLQREDRSPDTEAAFQDWLNAHAGHPPAFARATEVWEMLPGAATVRAATAANDDAPPRVRRTRRGAIALMAAASVAAIALAGTAWLSRPVVYETQPGQQQVTTLRDGTRVSLNTDSRITVAYTAGVRRVQLDRGEALFDVKHNPQRPFVVASGDDRVKALGTSFVVRRYSRQTAVTLINGKVEVLRQDGDGLHRIAMLAPGERLVVGEDGHPVVDRPSVDAVTAWRRGEIIFAGTTLREAAAELNRYGTVRIVIDDPKVAALRVSGRFETNDAAEFAVAVAQMNALRATRSGDTIVLSR